MINQNNSYKDDLLSTTWIGEVVDIEDPLLIGRIKVNVYGKFDTIPIEDIPWAYPGNNNTGGSSSGGGFFSVPKLGSIVSVKFDNGNLYHPEYFFNQKISEETKAEIEGSYQNAHSIIYDTESNPGPIKLFFTEEKGLMLDYNDSQINIRPDNTVYIEHANGKVVHIQKEKISLGKENESDEPAVLGDKNVDALNALADQINNLATSIQVFATSQAAITGAVFIYSPLTPALTALNTAMVPIISQIGAPIKSITIPKTRSSSVSLDGPSKL